MYGQYHSPTKRLTPSEGKVLTAFMDTLYKINPSLHKNLSRMKRVGVLPGYWDGVFSPTLEI